MKGLVIYMPLLGGILVLFLFCVFGEIYIVRRIKRLNGSALQEAYEKGYTDGITGIPKHKIEFTGYKSIRKPDKTLIGFIVCSGLLHPDEYRKGRKNP
jgi:ribosome modulation factor